MFLSFYPEGGRGRVDETRSGDASLAWEQMSVIVLKGKKTYHLLVGSGRNWITIKTKMRCFFKVSEEDKDDRETHAEKKYLRHDKPY